MITIRKALIKDAKEIYSLLFLFAKKNLLLLRPLNYIYENIRDFWVCEKNRKILACCSLHIVGWQNLAEIKSLAVKPKWQKKGIGKELVNKCLKEAKTLGVRKVFALTYAPQFFKKLKFEKTEKSSLSNKIWSECVNCPYFPDCKETALIIKI